MLPLETDHWGIDNGYVDTQQQWHPAPLQTRDAILKAMGVGDANAVAGDEDAVRVVGQGKSIPWSEPGQLCLEDGTQLDIGSSLPPICHWAITTSGLMAARSKLG